MLRSTVSGFWGRTQVSVFSQGGHGPALSLLYTRALCQGSSTGVSALGGPSSSSGHGSCSRTVPQAASSTPTMELRLEPGQGGGCHSTGAMGAAPCHE